MVGIVSLVPERSYRRCQFGWTHGRPEITPVTGQGVLATLHNRMNWP
jgi:hypothetical protein